MSLPKEYGFGVIPLSLKNREQAMESEMVTVREAGLFGVINDGNFISSEYIMRTSNTMNTFINNLISKNRSGKIYKIKLNDSPVNILTELSTNILDSTIEATDDNSKLIDYFSLYFDFNLVKNIDSVVVPLNDINVELTYKVYKGEDTVEKIITISLDTLNNLGIIKVDYSGGTITNESVGDSKLEISSIKLLSETETLTDNSIILFDILMNVKSDDVIISME